MMSKKVFCLIFSVIIVLSFSACQNKKTVSDEIYAMDTIVSIKIFSCETDSDKAIDNARKTIEKYENLLSITKGTDIKKINSSKGQKVKIEKDTYDLIKTAVKCSELTDGAFDITIYPLMKAWGFDNMKYKVPSEKEISDALSLVGYRNIELLDDSTVSLKNGAQIDFGGIAKGFITGKVVESLYKDKVKSAIINAGGNVYTLGTKEKNKEFTVGVQDPDNSDDCFLTLSLKDNFAVTSGAYQRYFEKGGKVYHHLMNPKTGKPVESDISSATVIGKDGTICDVYSTALYVMGIEKAIQFYKNNKNFDFILLNKDNTKVYISDSLKNLINLKDKEKIEINVIK